jgi:hypothetical protein
MRRLLQLVCLALVVHAPTLAQLQPATARPTVVVLRRGALGTYEAVAQHYRSRLRAPARVLTLQEGADAALLAKVRDLRPRLFFAIGQASYDLARKARLRPLIYTYAYRNHSPSDYHVTTQVRPAYVIETLEQLRPLPKRLAILAGPDTRWVATQVLQTAPPSGIEIFASVATDPGHALTLLRKLDRQTDALWLLADLSTLSEQVIRFAISLQYRRGLVLVAPTRTHVKRGALLALDYPPLELALRAVQATSRLLSQQRATRWRRELVRWRRRKQRWAVGQPRLSLNRLTAERIDRAIHRLVDRAEVVQ